MNEPNPFGAMLRDWRRRRRVSQLDLAAEAPMSQRHLSFLESGRAKPGREIVARLAEALDLPPRAANALHLAAGFAPPAPEAPLEAPALSGVRAAAEGMIAAAMPCPALAVDRHWRLVAANPMAERLMAAASTELLQPPVCVLTLSLSREGLGPMIVNWRDWRAYILRRLARDAAECGDAALLALRDRLADLPAPPGARPPGRMQEAAAMPLSLETPAGRLDLLSATTIFGTAAAPAAAELTIESFWPQGEEGWRVLRSLAG
ncbi:MAG: helix-turn-helix domain-containing protein [Pikeienuella sp.]|uniref:helix-turn-helix domain-containing protein n=1 Tax=Pikeienuella sp. TaxID=2831957 RepID=UPI00391C2810